MKPRDLLSRAREMIDRRDAMKAMEAGEPTDFADVPMHLRREWLGRNAVIKWTAPDGSTTHRETLGEHFARRDGPG